MGVFPQSPCGSHAGPAVVSAGFPTATHKLTPMFSESQKTSASQTALRRSGSWPAAPHRPCPLQSTRVDTVWAWGRRRRTIGGAGEGVWEQVPPHGPWVSHQALEAVTGVSSVRGARTMWEEQTPLPDATSQLEAQTSRMALRHLLRAQRDIFATRR